MAFGVLDQDPPPFFRQGASAFSKLIVFSAAAVFLMVADTRFQMLQPARAVLQAVLFPMQWLAQRPGLIAGEAADFINKVQSADAVQTGLVEKLRQQSARAYQVEQLELENRRLRALLELRPTLAVSGTAAQVLYDAADPYTRKVVIDRGQAHDVKLGAPVIDEKGVLGQVTRVFLLSSEVTLITDREHATPVLNVRTGARGVAYGESGGAPLLELRFMATNADIEVGDMLSTSGVDGIYPPGVLVGKVSKVERRAETAFARILCEPVGRVQGARHVMVLDPLSDQLPPRPQIEKQVPVASQKGGRR
jgi:rod shape-determining protein MreC